MSSPALARIVLEQTNLHAYQQEVAAAHLNLYSQTTRSVLHERSAQPAIIVTGVQYTPGVSK